jgi:hypothetical protein
MISFLPNFDQKSALAGIRATVFPQPAAHTRFKSKRRLNFGVGNGEYTNRAIDEAQLQKQVFDLSRSIRAVGDCRVGSKHDQLDL